MGDVSKQAYAKLHYTLLSRSDLSPQDKLVFAVLLDRQGAKAKAWPSYRWVADSTCLSKRSVLRSVANLIHAGALTIEKREGRTSMYRCQLVTGANQSPVPTSHPTGDNLSLVPVTICHPIQLKDTTQEPIRESPPNPPAGGDVGVGAFAEVGNGEGELRRCIRETWEIGQADRADIRRLTRLEARFAAVGATPAEIAHRLANLRIAMPDRLHTPEAVAKHWGTLAKSDTERRQEERALRWRNDDDQGRTAARA